MNKLLIGIAAVLVLCLVALPPVLGMVAAGQVPERIAEIDTHPLLEAELESIERGWFSSTMRVRLDLSAAGLARLDVDPSSETSLPVVVELTHGPVAFGEGWRPGLAHVVARPDAEAPRVVDLQRAYGMPYLFEFRGRSGFGGGLEYEIRVPEVDYADGAFSLRTSPARIEGTLDGDRLVSRIEVDTYEQSGEGATLSLRQIRGTADGRIVAPFGLLGDFDAAVARALATNPAAGPDAVLDVTGVDVSGRVGLDDEELLYDGRFEFAVEQMQVNRETELANVSMALAWNRIDQAAITDYTELAERVQGAGVLDPDTLAAEVVPIAERLIAAGPRLSMDPLRFESDGESFEAALDIEAQPDALPLPADPADANPALWLELFEGSARMTASKPLTRRIVTTAIRAQVAASGVPPDQAEAQATAQSGLTLAVLTGQGLLEDRGDLYGTELLLEDGRVTINGSPLPFGLLP